MTVEGCTAIGRVQSIIIVYKIDGASFLQKNHSWFGFHRLQDLTLLWFSNYQETNWKLVNLAWKSQSGQHEKWVALRWWQMGVRFEVGKRYYCEAIGRSSLEELWGMRRCIPMWTLRTTKHTQKAFVCSWKCLESFRVLNETKMWLVRFLFRFFCEGRGMLPLFIPLRGVHQEQFWGSVSCSRILWHVAQSHPRGAGD